MSADKMMVKAKGPVWHKKHKDQGIIPEGLRGVDKEATWGKSRTIGWLYGHGTFCLTPLKIPIVGIFQWMKNSGNEAKRMEQEIVKYTELIRKVLMDSKADDQKLYFKLKKEHHMQLVTVPRRGMDKSPLRKKMIREIRTRQNRKDFKKRSTTVEPMQGLIDNIFDLERCWMRSDDSNRWLFASMGIAVQMAQFKAYKKRQSTWSIKLEVLGI